MTRPKTKPTRPDVANQMGLTTDEKALCARRIPPMQPARVVTQARLERFLQLRQGILDLLNVWEKSRDELLTEAQTGLPIESGKISVRVTAGNTLMINTGHGEDIPFACPLERSTSPVVTIQ